MYPKREYYEKFRQQALDSVNAILPEGFTAQIMEKLKVNDPYGENLVIKPTQETEWSEINLSIPMCRIIGHVAPYVTNWEKEDYGMWVGFLTDLVKESVEKFRQEMAEPTKTMSKMKDFLDNKLDPGKIMPQLIGTRFNETLLRNVPHREKAGLAVIYRYVLENDGEKHVTVIIDNFLMKKLDMDPDQLFEAAMENRRKKYGIGLVSMNDAFFSHDPDATQAMDDPDCAIKEADMENAEPSWAAEHPAKTYNLSSTDYLYTPAVLLDDLTMKKIVKMFNNTPLIIIPLSTTGVMLIPDDENRQTRIKEMRTMLGVGTMHVCALEDILSFDIYRYNPEAGGLSVIAKE